MSDVKFWFDIKSGNPQGHAANGDPKEVMKGLHGKLDRSDTRKAGLREMTGRPLDTYIMPNDYALFIRGSSGDITKALNADIAAGIQVLGIVGDEEVDIRYFRHNEDLMKVTYMGIAGPTYWGSCPSSTYRPSAKDDKIWCSFGVWEAQDKYEKWLRQWKRDDKRGTAGEYPRKAVSISLSFLAQLAASTSGQGGWI